MSSTANTSCIPISANRGISSALFGLAIITYIIRTYIRTRIFKQFFTEDALLVFAIVCLCATTALAYTDMQNQYYILSAILHNVDYHGSLSLLDTIPRTLKIENVASTLWWCVIFPVKLAFLFFFRRSIFRWGDLYIWWWCAIVFTVIAFAVCVAADWLTCPYFSVEKGLSCSGPSGNYRVIRDTAITTVMDVLTDLIVLAFPIAILWQVRINVRHKAGIGIWLCLSIMMVVVAIVRMAGIKLAGGSVDIVWLAFWQQQESSIAVIMVSMSAFRSLFVENGGVPKPRRHLSDSAKNWRRRLVRRALGSDDEADVEANRGLPRIPRATLTGMSEIIREV